MQAMASRRGSPEGLEAVLFIACRYAGNGLSKVVPGGLANGLKIVGIGSGSFRRSNDMKGEEMVIPGAKLALARRK
jgi:hypothetical protein